MKIAVFAPHWIGDLVMSNSLLQVIKERYPTSKIDVYAMGFAAGVAELMVEVDEVITIPFAHGELRWRARRAFARTMPHYDLAFVLPNSFKSALIPWMANGTTRVGWLGEYRYGLLTNKVVCPKAHLPLQASQYQALIELAHATNPHPNLWSKHSTPRQPRLCITKQQYTQVASLISTDFHHVPYVALCPSAAFGPAKCWPPVHFATLADILVDQLGMRVVFVGGAADAAVINSIIEQCRMQQGMTSVAGRTTLIQAASVLKRAVGVVCNDSGLMHIAAALDVPLVAIYGPTSPAHTPPLANRVALCQTEQDCRPCKQRTCPLKHHKCMADILPLQVYSCLNQLLGLENKSASIVK